MPRDISGLASEDGNRLREHAYRIASDLGYEFLAVIGRRSSGHIYTFDNLPPGAWEQRVDIWKNNRGKDAYDVLWSAAPVTAWRDDGQAVYNTALQVLTEEPCAISLWRHIGIHSGVILQDRHTTRNWMIMCLATKSDIPLWHAMQRENDMYAFFGHMHFSLSREVGGVKSSVEILTPQQIAVVELSAQGLTAEEVAERLGISMRTVNAHLNMASERLGVRNKASLCAVSVALGLIELASM